jgi:hypothetical protein
MNRNVDEAASGTGEIAQNITGVAEAARLTSQGVTETQQATAEMARMSTELSSLVAHSDFGQRPDATWPTRAGRLVATGSTRRRSRPWSCSG